MPAWRDELIAISQGLRDSLSAEVLGQAVAAVFRPVNLVDCDSSSGDLILNP